MWTITRPLLLMLLAIALIGSFGCNGVGPINMHRAANSYCCEPPDEDVFKQMGVDLDFTMKYSEIISGTSKVKADPKIISLASQAERDARLQDYLDCVAKKRDKFTNEQVIYMRNLTRFAANQPSSEACIKSKDACVEWQKGFSAWQKDNPFPPRPSVKQPTGAPRQTVKVTACSLKVVASWEGTSAPEKTAECTYTAPTGARIIEAFAEELSSHNGSRFVSFNENEVCARISAKPDGMWLDRKVGWMDIKVIATIDYSEE